MNHRELPDKWLTVFYNSYEDYYSFRAEVHTYNFSSTRYDWKTKHIDDMEFVFMIGDNIICRDALDTWICLRCPEFYKGCSTCDGKNESNYKAYIADTFNDLLRLSFVETEMNDIIPMELHDKFLQGSEIRRHVYYLCAKKKLEIYYDNYYCNDVLRSDILCNDGLPLSICNVQELNACEECIVDKNVNDMDHKFYLPMEMVCNIMEYVPLYNFVKTRYICKDYYNWFLEEINKRKILDGILLILSSDNFCTDDKCGSLYLYYKMNVSDKDGEICYQAINDGFVVCFDNRMKEMLNVYVYFYEEVVCTGDLHYDKIDMTTEINKNREMRVLSYADNNVSYSPTGGVNDYHEFYVDKYFNLYVERDTFICHICKLSNKMINIINTLNYMN